jgi:DNA-cytosine methyltransferase
MRFGSICSGIEAASVAFGSIEDWKAVWFSEIEKFPCAVLAHHYPDVPNLGDMTKITQSEVFKNEKVDLICGGTPCQSFSIAGLRKGMDDARGNLALEFIRICDAAKPRWVLWENVPGVLSSNGGKDFGSFLGALGEIGYGWAYRVLDAQYFGVPQRRRRVFVVGYLGDWRPPATVLFERQGSRGDFEKGSKKGERVTGEVKDSVGEANRYDGNRKTVNTITAKMQGSTGWAPYNETEHLITEAVLEQPHAFKIRQGKSGGGKGYLGKDNELFTVATGSDQNILHFSGRSYDVKSGDKPIGAITTGDAHLNQGIHIMHFSGQSLTAKEGDKPIDTLDTGGGHMNRGIHLLSWQPDKEGQK